MLNVMSVLENVISDEKMHSDCLTTGAAEGGLIGVLGDGSDLRDI